MKLVSSIFTHMQWCFRICSWFCFVGDEPLQPVVSNLSVTPVNTWCQDEILETVQSYNWYLTYSIQQSIPTEIFPNWNHESGVTQCPVHLFSWHFPIFVFFKFCMLHIVWRWLKADVSKISQMGTTAKLLTDLLWTCNIDLMFKVKLNYIVFAFKSDTSVEFLVLDVVPQIVNLHGSLVWIMFRSGAQGVRL